MYITGTSAMTQGAIRLLIALGRGQEIAGGLNLNDICYG